MNPEPLSKLLSEQGAVLHLLSLDVYPLVGAWEWINDHRVFYFEAGCDTEFGGHLLEFDHAEAPHSLGVAFLNAEGDLLAYLAPIAEAVDDVQNYKSAWLRWLTVLNSMKPFIQEVKSRLIA